MMPQIAGFGRKRRYVLHRSVADTISRLAQVIRTDLGTTIIDTAAVVGKRRQRSPVTIHDRWSAIPWIVP